jgi:hypothetical protein
MRFRTKFQWGQIALAAIWIPLSYSWFHKPTAALGIRYAYLIGGITWALVAIAYLASYFFTWWDVTDLGLMQRKLWRAQTIPWSEIVRVGPWKPNSKLMYDWLAVDYARNGPMSDRGTLLFQPTQRDSLVRTIQAHAPQADYYLFTDELSR